MTVCREVMTPTPVCCLPTDWVDVAAQLMKNEDVGSVPVVKDQESKELVGIITDRDIVVKVVATERDYKSTVIEDAMTLHPATCRPDDELQAALDIMAEAQVRRIPVVDADKRIVGIIAQADIATRLEAPEEVAEVVEEISRPG